MLCYAMQVSALLAEAERRNATLLASQTADAEHREGMPRPQVVT